MPAAALSRRQYAGFRTGHFEGPTATTAVEFTTPWDLRKVTPDIFPVPASVIFGQRSGKPGALPEDAQTFVGRIAPRGTRWKVRSRTWPLGNRTSSGAPNCGCGLALRPALLSGRDTHSPRAPMRPRSACRTTRNADRDAASNKCPKHT